jgi:Fic family protein
MRIKILETEMTIPNSLFKELKKLRKNSKLRKAVETIIEAGEIIENESKVNNANKAAKAKQQTAKEKVKSTINLLKQQGEEINPYKVAKIAKISYNTARKYTNTKGE